ncbi:uncharacterized protein LOC129728292 [Wyeomyia smithii]|uniref:uncharacterized protein LOC129728292 n=1 Tax=Wyeomyia smithii TaxID=174621 RepID=UPI00246822CC|nr:uncharacterized protein LOC129728292 [Wyeomyia smithii]
MASLPKVLCHFRQRQVAVAGDIREMFHQLKIRSEDCQALRFLYRNDPSQKPEVYVMEVAIFGATCSPCSASYIKNTNAMEYQKEFPEAATAIVENHYVDDYLDSRDTVEEMGKLASEVKMVQATAGFELRNWRSNSAEVLKILGEQVTEVRKDFTADKGSRMERVLGMAWIPDEDVFTYSLKLPQDFVQPGTVLTKRGILRFVMSVFDPLGLISSLLIHGKMIIQDLWRSQVGWDDAVPYVIQGRWRRWIESLSKLDEVRVPRCYFPDYDSDSFRTLQLHVFVDASESAFTCVVYFRMIDRGQPRCALVASKAKVAPLKPLSIPRLELQAVVIGSRIAKSVTEYHSLPVYRRFYWSDSKTVLSWIKSDARRYHQYVAVRIGEILEDTTVEEWRWVPTMQNVADEATKWGKGPKLHQDSRWFTGPDFLYRHEDEWPMQHNLPVDVEEELRAIHVHRIEEPRAWIKPERFSRWERMLRSTAYVYSFIDHYVEHGKKGAMQNGRGLRQEDFVRAERALLRLAQAEIYTKELLLLEKAKELVAAKDVTVSRRLQFEKDSPLRKLSPFLDEFCVIRMESRIEKSPWASHEAKYPVILPKNHKITELLIDYYHRKFGHHNGETVVNEIRQRFYISALRTTVRSVVARCQWCIIYNAKPEIPRMAPHTQARVTPWVRPFSRVGIDYFGPYMIKIGRSQVKRWVALFTCMTIRAIHLEVTTSLSTESFKLALRRFIARRGAPAEIYTDHGTNFVGASRELASQIATMNQELSETFTNTNTRWIFIPPSSPHMGGAWERMVRSVKTAMNSIHRTRAPSEEVFHTVLCEAESMVNSRPLTYMPLETSDQEALTPNHFILLSSNGVKQTEKAPTAENETLQGGWNICRHILDQFWIRWTREYLPDLTRRTKWHQDVRPVQEGDVVFIMGEVIRNRWTRGKVLKVIPGKDGRIRQAYVKTSTGVLRRPVAKLAVLDVLSRGNPAVPEQNYGEGNVAGDVTAGNGSGNEASTGNTESR